MISLRRISWQTASWYLKASQVEMAPVRIHCPMRDAMNLFLSQMGVTFRRDPDTKRPRINKPDSKLDKEQKSSGEFYYVSATD